MRIKSTRLIHVALFVAMASLAACNGGGGDSTAPAATYTIGGAVAGLTGSGLVLQNNGGDDLSISANSTFTFATKLASGASYAVTVLTQPTGQTCSVASGSGTVSSANVTSVSVTCSSSAYTVGGSVNGLTGTGLVLRNNGGGDLSVSAGATAFTFTNPVANGAAYAVTVQTQPTGQTCSVASGSGTVSGANVTSVSVTCSSSAYTVGGSVTNLTGSGLVLRNNGGDDLSVSAGATVFTFPNPVANGAAYAVTVQTQPAGQTCSVTSGSGTVSGANVATVAVTCSSATTTYTVGGNVTNLTGTLVLQDSGTISETLDITTNGNFTFATPRQTGDQYVVQVQTPPAGQTCSMAGHVGMVGSANVTTISVTCSANTYSIGGTISGLTADGLILQNNVGDNLTVAANATAFTFNTPIANGSGYAVTVLNQPAGLFCTVTAGTGAVSGAAVTDVSVACSPDTYTIGGTVTNLTGTGLVLQNNGGGDLSVGAGATAFTFSAPLSYNSPYDVTVLAQPAGPAQVCTVVANGSGTVTADVANVSVTCVDSYTIGGMIYGAADGVGPILQNNGGDNLFIPAITTVAAGGTPFTFTTPIADGASYTVTQLARARAPAQDCRLGMPVPGTVSGGDVTGLTINCALSTIVPSFAYVTNGYAYPANLVPDTVSAFAVGAGGDLTAATTPTTATGDGPYAVAVDPTGRFVYAVNSDSASVSAYSIEASGALAVIDANDVIAGTQPTIATGDIPKSIALHPSGKFAYVLNQGNGSATGATGKTLSAYSINETSGALTVIDADQAPDTQATIATGAYPYEVAVDPLGRFAYVANNGDDTVSAYAIDQTTGALAAVGAAVAAGAGPISIAVDPTGKCALVANNSSDGVMSYMIDQVTGALTSVSTVTGAVGSAPRSIAVDPDTGLYAYVANAGSGDVSAYGITLSTCAIAAINADAVTPALTIAAGTVPFAIDVDPSGQFVYVANFGVFDSVNRAVMDPGNVSVYSINAGTGALTPLGGSPFAAGYNPTFVTTTD